MRTSMFFWISGSFFVTLGVILSQPVFSITGISLFVIQIWYGFDDKRYNNKVVWR